MKHNTITSHKGKLRLARNMVAVVTNRLLTLVESIASCFYQATADTASHAVIVKTIRDEIRLSRVAILV
jgi:hypothetical protein